MVGHEPFILLSSVSEDLDRLEEAVAYPTLGQCQPCSHLTLACGLPHANQDVYIYIGAVFLRGEDVGEVSEKVVFADLGNAQEELYALKATV